MSDSVLGDTSCFRFVSFFLLLSLPFSPGSLGSLHVFPRLVIK